MSVIQENKIDGMGVNNKSQELNLLITDHLDWENEYEHLLILQEKINAYINYIKSKQYVSVYPNKIFKRFAINIWFKYDITENCFKFLDVIANQVEELGIVIKAELRE